VTFFCPRCSGAIEFADDAPGDTIGRCSCSVTSSLDGLRHIEWQDGFEERVKAVDWGALENAEGKSGIDFRYTIAFRIGQLTRGPTDAGEALTHLERAMLLGDRPLALAHAALPFLEEALAQMTPENRGPLGRLVGLIRG